MIGRLEYKWIVGIIYVLAIFMDLLDITIVNVALPAIGADLRVDPSTGATQIQWVVTGYLLSLAVFIPVSGWAGDRFGTKRVFMCALTIFLSGSLACGLAWNIESLVAFRVLQGVGGGMLTPVGMAMLLRAFPPAERIAASAVLVIPTVVAPATGPVIGGYLAEYQSWHWIFFINIPIGVIAFILSAIYLREEKHAAPGRFDIPGFVLGAAGMLSVMYALAEAGLHGFGGTRVVAFGSLGLVLLATFTIVELRTAEPMIDVRILRNRLFAASNSVQIIAMSAFAGVLFLLPLLLQAEKGYTPFKSGLTTFPQALGVILMIQIASRLYHHIGPRRLLIAGLVLSGLNTLTFELVGLETSAWTIRGLMFMRGMTLGLVLSPLQTAAFGSMPAQEMGRASAVYNTARQAATAFGVAVIASVLTSRLTANGATLGDPATRDGAITAFHETFIVGSALMTIGVIAALFVSDKEAAPTMRRRQSQEAGEETPAPAR